MTRTRRRSIAAAGAAAVLAVLTAAPAYAVPAPLIANGSFESNPYWQGSYIVLNNFNYSTYLTDWIRLRGEVDLVSSYWPAADGSQSLELSGTTDTGTIAQNVATVPGHPYRVAFAMSGNPECGPAVKQVVVTFGSAAAVTNSYNVVTSGTSVANMHWQSMSDTFTASSTTTQLSFGNTDPLSVPCGPVLDAVSVTDATPPPASLAEVPVPAVLALAGMLTIAGATALRRRRT